MTHEPETIPPTPRKRLFPFVFILIVGVVIAAVLGIMGGWLKDSKTTSLSIGQNVDDFSLTTFSGETFEKTDMSGKIVLVNFWASWCTSCDEEGAMLQEVWQQVHTSEDYLFLGIDYVDTEKPALEYLQLNQITYPNGPDLGSKISALFKIKGVPETFLIGRDGKLVAMKIGPFSSADEIRQFLSLAEE